MHKMTKENILLRSYKTQIEGHPATTGSHLFRTRKRSVHYKYSHGLEEGERIQMTYLLLIKETWIRNN